MAGLRIINSKFSLFYMLFFYFCQRHTKYFYNLWHTVFFTARSLFYFCCDDADIVCTEIMEFLLTGVLFNTVGKHKKSQWEI